MLFVSHTVKYAHTNGQIAWKCVSAWGAKKMVLSLMFFSRTGWDEWQEDYCSSERWNQDKEELWTVWVRLLLTPKTLRYTPFPHWFILSSILSGQRAERCPLRRYPACECVPRGGQEGLKCGKRGLDIFHGTILWKCKSALRNIPLIGWGSHKRGDVRRNHAWLNTKSTQRNEI